MHFSTLLGLAATIASAEAFSQGFNYGATKTDGSGQQQSDYESLFTRAQNLQGTSGFTSARLYTMIQEGTTNTPSSAFQAAVNTNTSLLLGIWCSGGQDIVTNEISALQSAIQQYGVDFTNLITAISVGSEDLYRVSPTGVENDSGAGATPDELVSYIKQVRAAIANTGAKDASIGHVDTWTAWVNGSNNAVIEAVDWLGMDTYPYFEATVANSIQNGNSTYWDAYDKTLGVSGGKEVWITETGWPISGKTSGQAVASVANAETYWQDVACEILGNYNVWWYTIQDSDPTTPDPSFGLIGSDLQSAPLYDLTCKKQSTKQSSSSNSSSVSSTQSSGKGPLASATKTAGHAGGAPAGYSQSGGAAATGGTMPQASANGTAPDGSTSTTAGATSATAGSSGTTPSASSPAANGASKAGSAASAGLLAIFALVATL